MFIHNSSTHAIFRSKYERSFTRQPLFKFLYLIHQYQIDSSTIDGNVEFVHSQYSCFHSVFVSEKIIKNGDNFIIKGISYSKISVLYFLFLHVFI